MARIRVGELELYYELGGADTEETVVFINGLTMDTSAWTALEAQLAPTYRTLRYDCRGQGQSDKPKGPYLPRQHAQDLKGLLEALKLERVHLVGHSNGGVVGALYAGGLAQTPPLSLTMIASLIRIDAIFEAIFRSWRAALETGGPVLRFEVALPWVWGRNFLEERAELLEGFRAKAAGADPQVIAWLMEGLMTLGDARKALRAYEGPVLAVVGQEDLLTPLRYSHEIVEWARQGILVTIDRAGHGAPVEQPGAVARVLNGFLERREDFVTPLWQEEEP